MNSCDRSRRETLSYRSLGNTGVNYRGSSLVCHKAFARAEKGRVNDGQSVHDRKQGQDRGRDLRVEYDT